MTRCLQIVISIGLLLLAGWTHAAPSAAEVADRVQAFYGRIRTYQASFEQIYRAKVQNTVKRSRGKVFFRKPGKISFRYHEPKGNRVVSNGKRIAAYDRQHKQLYRSTLKRSQYPAAVAFLMGKRSLKRTFKLRLLDPERRKIKKGYVLEGIPVDATAAYRKILLYVDDKSYQVRRVLVLDAQGNQNRFTFSKPTVNQPIAKSEFKLKTPRGATVVRP